MLLLVTIGLVLIGAISLVIGFVSSSLAPIYLSIACSIVAGGVLVVFSRMSRRQAPVAEGGPAPLPEAAPAPALQEEVVGAATQTSAPVVPDLPFPIEDYESLKVNEIVPLLPELDLDELDMVREREEAGRNRATIVKKIDDLIDELEAQDEAMAVPPAPVEEPTAAVPAVGGSGGDLPIEDYDSLSVAQILPLLPELDDDELETVAEYEETHKNRAQIVKRIDEIFETGEVAGAAAEKVGAAAPASAKKKAPAKKSPAKKSAAASKKKAAAPAKKTAAKATKKAAAPAKKKAAAPAKKATAAKKAAPAKKKAAAPAKKAAKATTKKAAKKR